MAAEFDYVRTETAKLLRREEGKEKTVTELLWGDRVRVLEKQRGDGRGVTRVRARGMEGLVDNDALGGNSLLEIYFIDVGQGDGVLVRTPTHRHVLVDGGFIRRKQPTKRNAADFVDWKFARDYQMNTIDLDAVVASHCDADHYGGLWDLLNPDEVEELDIRETPRVKAFYHAGVGWWTDGTEGNRSLGPAKNGLLTRLLSDRESIAPRNRGLRPQGEWGKFLGCVHALGAQCDVQYLGWQHPGGYMPGFEPRDGDAAIRVLAPVDEGDGEGRRLPYLGSDSQTTNGHSIMLRVDYGRARILLTGDLNAASQRRILEAYRGHRHELAADVVKGCHHGSDDCSYEFLAAVNAGCTIISSGDDESHAHPRPAIVAASAQTGFTRVAEDRLVTPLVYSTEISRSYRLADASRIVAKNEDGTEVRVDIERATVRMGSGEGAVERAMKDTRLVSGVVYGLVNVRTDGNTILCATLNEQKKKWEIETFESRF
jgi:beta-lactamase superfamily II metal-dependent hydrolase